MERGTVQPSNFLLKETIYCTIRDTPTRQHAFTTMHFRGEGGCTVGSVLSPCTMKSVLFKGVGPPCEQTNTCEHIIFPYSLDAVGYNTYCGESAVTSSISDLLFSLAYGMFLDKHGAVLSNSPNLSPVCVKKQNHSICALLELYYFCHIKEKKTPVFLGFFKCVLLLYSLHTFFASIIFIFIFSGKVGI